MPPNIQAELNKYKLTGEDYYTILLRNPFWNMQSTPIDFTSICTNYVNACGRYNKEVWTYPYEGFSNQYGTNVCTSARMHGISSSQTQSLSKTYTDRYTVSLAATETLPGGLVKFGESTSLTWSNTEGITNTSSTSQSAMATVGCSSPSYAAAADGDITIDVYYDGLYGTFLFNPIPNCPNCRKIAAHGTVLAPSGPVPGEPVDLLYGDTTYHTSTFNNGNFVFYSPDVQESRPPFTAELSVGGVSQTVIVGDAAATTVTIPQPPPALAIFVQSRPSGSANLSMGVTNISGVTTATNVTVTAITGITATGATFVYNPGLLVVPFVIPGAAALKPGATSGFNLNFTATSGSAAAPFSFVITVQADNVPAFTTIISVPAPPPLTISLQATQISTTTAEVFMDVLNSGSTTATDVEVTAITAITATGATLVYAPGLPGSPSPPFAVPGATALSPGATSSSFILDFNATQGSAQVPFSFVVTMQAANVPPFSTTISVQ